MADSPGKPFDAARGLKYLKMCYLGPLPHHYLPHEANRMAMAFFVLGAIDMATPVPTANDEAPPPEPIIKPADRPRLRKWILAHKHPSGGFCGSPSTVLPARHGEDWDFEAEEATYETSGHAQLPATVFALQMLAMLADEDGAERAYAEVHRKKTLEWLRELQREDGSFGENLANVQGRGWYIGGGHDMRHCYLAALARWMLRGDVQEGGPGWVDDIDVEGVVKYISKGQTYDGGMAQGPNCESHAGHVYCAIAALCLLDRPLEGEPVPHASERLRQGIRDVPGLVRFLVSRQFAYLERQPEDILNDANFYDDQTTVDSELESENFRLPDLSSKAPVRHVGFNGRCNKIADTCYCWWVAASLANLGQADLVHRPAARRFMLDKTQHFIGGFGKHAGSPPDIQHTFFGVAALAVMGDPAMKPVDPALAVTTDTVRNIEKARRALVELDTERECDGGLEAELLDMALAARKGGRPAWLD